MNIEKILKDKNVSILQCAKHIGVSYNSLYKIVKRQVNIESCEYGTLKKLAKYLDCQVQQLEDTQDQEVSFDIFRSNIQHAIKRDELNFILKMINSNDIEAYYETTPVKAFYLVACVDILCKKNDLGLCDKYEYIRKKQLKHPFYVSQIKNPKNNAYIEEFKAFNIYEVSIYDVC